MMVVSPKEAISRWNELPAGTCIDAGRGNLLEQLQGLRWLPGRRLTLAAVSNSREVVAKLYSTTPKACREFSREHDAIWRLSSMEVAAPTVLGTSESRGASVLLMEKLRGATAESLLAEGDFSKRVAIGVAVYRWLLDVADRGCIQTDVHAGNFFLSNGRWYMLDALSCRFSFSPSEMEKSLARWLVQFTPRETDAVLRALQESGPRPSLGTLARTASERAQRWAHMLSKTERECTAYRRMVLPSVTGMIRREFLLPPDVEACVRAPDAVNVPMLKDGGSASVVEPAPGLVLKRYNIKSVWHACKRVFTTSRARTSWRAAHLLDWAGIPTARALAFFEENGFLRNRAWLLMEKVPGRPVTRDDLERGLLAQVEEVFALMARYRWSHGDMKASNLLVHEDRVYLIDLDAFTRHRSGRRAKRALIRDMRRFVANWQDLEFAKRVEARLLAAIESGRGQEK